MAVPNTHEGPARIGAVMDGVRSRGGSVYCIGIGGVMMASLAILTARAGFPVSGSDRAFAGGCGSPTAQRLTAAGIRLFGDHAAAHLPPDCGAVIYTVAITEDNPEYRAAAERGIPRFSRADYIGWLMTGYHRRVGVAGMHGKSTCTSMCAQVFLDAAADPTVLIGADYPPIGGAFRLGGREMFLFEACEYMDSFLDFRPTVAVLLNAELEHVDYFRDLSQIEDSFFRFASLTGRDGVTVCNVDDACVSRAAARALAAGGTGRVVTFSAQGTAADVCAHGVQLERGLPAFTLVVDGEAWGEVCLRVPGIHQVCDALAAVAAAWVCGLARADILRGLADFTGVARRMEFRGEVRGGLVFDDYGHHPTEIRATLAGAAALVGTHPDGTPGRLLCVFQPHTYSRTARLYDDFRTAFDAADRLILLDVYAARETDTQGVSSAGLAEDIRARGRDAQYAPSPADAAAAVQAFLCPGDVAVIMGAGDVTRVSDLLCPRTK